MTLRPGGGPARLLLELWHAQAYGNRWCTLPPRRACLRLLQLGFIQMSEYSHLYGLTEAGRYAAQTLDASSP